jgi:hypothetical protein
MKYKVGFHHGNWGEIWYTLEIEGENVSSLLYKFLNKDFDTDLDPGYLSEENIVESFNYLFENTIVNNLEYVTIGDNKYKVDDNYESLFMDFLTRCELKLDLRPYNIKSSELVLEGICDGICEIALFDITGGFGLHTRVYIID